MNFPSYFSKRSQGTPSARRRSSIFRRVSFVRKARSPSVEYLRASEEITQSTESLMAMIEQARLSCEGANEVATNFELSCLRTNAAEVSKAQPGNCTLSPPDFITASEETAQNLLLMIKAEKARHSEEETR